MDHRELLSGFVRLHILLHAADAPIYGQWITEELARHGYRLSAGTLYPMLQGMEKKGYLSSHTERHGRAVRKLYVATDLGREALALVRDKARELFGELVEGHGRERIPKG
ncbi:MULTISPECIES: PadR family transcriptional regulator [Sphingomonas]|jgi:PadR family transcriptional regulator PadR|uniref:PadR family transcriptional regulator n=2 Tax=Sphingomonas TaxID=13687 RepID=A0A916TES8_9SPHN|nr:MULTISPECIES: PadR family transcriptional regulator [Sphingomonas]MAX01319.1 PadR family transcriptional regulator [Sphingomonas sp.]PAX08933.1 PadR family transcriptional regulator [Sphingomonas lenta]GGB42591.1 PadR family transcriptional regulator [Sphingomonas metalli]